MSIPTVDESRVDEKTQVLIPEVRQETHRRHVSVGVSVVSVVGIAALVLVSALALLGVGPFSRTADRTPKGVAAAVDQLCRSSQTATLPRTVSDPGAIPPGTFSGSSITMRVVLCQSNVTAGTPIKAVVLFTNHAVRSFPIHACTNGPWILVGIGNARIPNPLSVPTVGCSSIYPSYIPTGTTPVTTTAQTNYAGCYQGVRHGLDSQGQPPCQTSGNLMPPLPPGHYAGTLFVVGSWLPVGTAPAKSAAISLKR